MESVDMTASGQVALILSAPNEAEWEHHVHVSILHPAHELKDK